MNWCITIGDVHCTLIYRPLSYPFRSLQFLLFPWMNFQSTLNWSLKRTQLIGAKLDYISTNLLALATKGGC